MKKFTVVCMCKTCGKSSNAGNQCLYEEKEFMAVCPAFIRIKEKKKVEKK